MNELTKECRSDIVMKERTGVGQTSYMTDNRVILNLASNTQKTYNGYLSTTQKSELKRALSTRQCCTI